MKQALFPVLAALLVLSACGANQAEITDNDGTSSSSMDHSMMDHSSSSIDGMTDDSSSADDSADESADARIIEVTVDNWAFAPTAITAATGEKVIVRLTGVEGIHSFAIEDLGINVRVEAGQTVDVEIPTDKAGTFAFRCRIPCGDGHMDMKGTLTIS